MPVISNGKDDTNLLPYYLQCTEDLYQAAAVHGLHIGHLAFILRSITLRSTRDTLPSWVPDWSIGARLHTLLLTGSFQARGIDASATQYRLEGSKVEVQGKFIDRLQITVPTPDFSLRASRRGTD